MHKEYAIDPNILISFDRISAILGSCGWHKGKVVCEYPKRKWKRKVYDACSSVLPQEKSKIIELLNSHPFCRRKDMSPYDNDVPWLDSAKAEHSRKAFTAILSDRDEPSSQVIDGQYVTEKNELWAPPPGISPRTPDDFAYAISLLAQNSSRIVFVDPHFDSFTQRFTTSFTAMLKEAISEYYKRPSIENNSDGNLSIELHLKVKRGYGNPESYATIAARDKKNILHELPKYIPVGLTVNVHLWKEHDPPIERLHNRYFLSDMGGLSFGIGLDVADMDDEGAVQSDDISILTKEQHQKHLGEYCSDSTCFESLENFIVIGSLQG